MLFPLNSENVSHFNFWSPTSTLLLFSWFSSCPTKCMCYCVVKNGRRNWCRGQKHGQGSQPIENVGSILKVDQLFPVLPQGCCRDPHRHWDPCVLKFFIWRDTVLTCNLHTSSRVFETISCLLRMPKCHINALSVVKLGEYWQDAGCVFSTGIIFDLCVFHPWLAMSANAKGMDRRPTRPLCSICLLSPRYSLFGWASLYHADVSSLNEQGWRLSTTASEI